MCEAWDVGEGDLGRASTGLRGHPDAHLRRGLRGLRSLPVAEQAVASLSGSFLVDVPYQGHNVLGSLDCYLNIRNAWIEDPTSAPDTGCIADIPPPTFATR